MKRKKYHYIGAGSYTRENETQIRNSKREGMRRKDGSMEEFNGMA